MKTILIYVHDSNIVRNILRTRVLSTLLESAAVGKVVLLMHPLKVDEYRKEFAHPKVVCDAYPSNMPGFAEQASWFLARQTIPTRNVRIKIDEILDRSAQLRLPKYVLALALHTLSKHSLALRKFFRFWFRLPFKQSLFKSLMERHKPDLVFLPTTYDINDIRMLKYCTSRGIPTVGMVKSWDNLLGKDSLLVFSDWLVVHSETVKRHAIELCGYPERRIFISGIPHFDYYADPAFTTTRESFFKEMGLDPKKRLILYACMGAWIAIHEREVVEILANVVNGGKLVFPSQLLVRLHPAYLSEDEALKKIPGIVLDRPGKGSFERNRWRADFEFTVKDNRRLANTLKHADVIIHSGSTMSIDAVAFDLPIVNVAFDGYATDEKYERSARRLMEKDHYRPIVESDGVTVVWKREDLVPALNAYLKDRSLHREGRARIVREQLYKLDGKAGERVGSFIVSKLMA